MATPGELFSDEILSCLDQEDSEKELDISLLMLAASQSSNALQIRARRVEWAEPFSAKRGGRAVASSYRFWLAAGS